MSGDDLFVPIPLWLLRRRDISDAAKIAWARLKLFAGRKGSCNTSHEVLAGECGTSRRTIQRAVEELSRAGLVALKRGRYGIEYTFPDAPKRCISDQPQMRQNGASETVQMRQNGALDAPKMDICSLYSERGIKDVSCSSPDERVSEEFALEAEPKTPALKSRTKPQTLSASQGQWFTEFWSRYPRKIAKADAEKSFRREVKTDADFAAIMSGFERDLLTGGPLDKESTFQPYPATWINRKDWRIPVEAAKPARSAKESIRAAMATDTVPDWEGGGR